MSQSRHWVFTLNNWTEDEDDALRSPTNPFTYLVYGYETGQSGTPHLQGYVVFQQKKRLTQAKLLVSPRAALFIKRGTPQQAIAYCKKDGEFYEFGTAPQGRNGTTQFDLFQVWLLDHDTVPSQREIARAFPLLWLRYELRLRKLANHLQPPPTLEEEIVFRPWQVTLKQELLSDADDRTVAFYVDPEGGKGKTYFTRAMLSTYPDKVQSLSVGKRDDIAHAIDDTKSIFLFNVPRGGMEFLQYTVLEQLKDRMVFSPKYDSRTKLFRHRTHVVVFCNEEPDWTKMSVDRYQVVNLTSTS